MRILIDGDACPSKQMIKQIGIKYRIPIHIYVDSSHFFTDDYFQIHIIAQGKDAVDMVLVNQILPNDIVITQDYGLASMALTKTDYIANPLGFRYTLNNIDELLFKRHLNQKARRAGKSGSRNKKRTKENEENLKKTIENIILNHII